MIKFFGLSFMFVLVACGSFDEGVGVSDPPFVPEAEHADASPDVSRDAAVDRVPSDAGTSD